MYSERIVGRRETPASSSEKVRGENYSPSDP
jgi:hypothetical protein